MDSCAERSVLVLRTVIGTIAANPLHNRIYRSVTRGGDPTPICCSYRQSVNLGGRKAWHAQFDKVTLRGARLTASGGSRRYCDNS